MKRVILILCYILPVFNIAQNKEYYRLVNAAELHIVNENYTSAIENYELAFVASNSPMTLDIVNFLKCSCIVDKLLDKKRTSELLARGLKLYDLEKDQVLKRCLAQRKPTFTESNFLVIDTVYRSELRKLDTQDQYFRLKNGVNQKYRHKIDSLDKKIVSKLLSLIESKGFPSESQVGVDNISGYQGWEIVIWHYQQLRSRNNAKPNVFSSILFLALKNDKISPLEYATFVELQNDPLYLKYKINPLITLKKGKYRILKSTILNSKDINEERESIGLCSLKDYIVKALYQAKNKCDFNFGISNGYYDLSMVKKGLKKELKSKSVAFDERKL